MGVVALFGAGDGGAFTLLTLIGGVTIGPLVAGWIAGGRLATRARRVHGQPSLPPWVTRLLCIIASFVTTFGGCVAIMASGLT